MASTVCELRWLSFFLKDFDIQLSLPIPLFRDNNSALHIVVNPVFHERTKHLKVDCHLVRHHSKEGFIALQFLSSKQQLANIFTKTLFFLQFNFLPSKLGFVDYHHSLQLEGGMQKITISLMQRHAAICSQLILYCSLLSWNS